MWNAVDRLHDRPRQTALAADIGGGRRNGTDKSVKLQTRLHVAYTLMAPPPGTGWRDGPHGSGGAMAEPPAGDRKSVGEGKGGAGRVDPGGRRMIKQKKKIL